MNEGKVRLIIEERKKLEPTSDIAIVTIPGELHTQIKDELFALQNSLNPEECLALFARRGKSSHMLLLENTLRVPSEHNEKFTRVVEEREDLKNLKLVGFATLELNRNRIQATFDQGFLLWMGFGEKLIDDLRVPSQLNKLTAWTMGQDGISQVRLIPFAAPQHE
jgi:hypothetical protein